MRTILFAACIVALASSTSFAQTHPCDQAPPPQVTISSGAPHRVQFCSPQSDMPEALVAKLNGAQIVDLVPVVAKTAPSATGKVLYESALFLQVSKGTYTLEIALYNKNSVTGEMQLGLYSSPLSFAVVDETPRPSAPEIKNVVKG